MRRAEGGKLRRSKPPVFCYRLSVIGMTHNLVKLARLSKLDLSMEQEILLDKINDFNLEIRYPQYKSEFYKKCTKEFSADYYQKISEMMIWLKSQIE